MKEMKESSSVKHMVGCENMAMDAAMNKMRALHMPKRGKAMKSSEDKMTAAKNAPSPKHGGMM